MSSTQSASLPRLQPQPGDGAYLVNSLPGQGSHAAGINGQSAGPSRVGGGGGGRRRGGGPGDEAASGRPRQNGHGPSLDAASAPFMPGQQRSVVQHTTLNGTPLSSTTAAPPPTPKQARGGGGRQGQRRSKADAAVRAELAHQNQQPSSSTGLRPSAADFTPPAAQLAHLAINETTTTTTTTARSEGGSSSRAASEGPKSRHGRGRGGKGNNRSRAGGSQASAAAARSDTEAASAIVTHPPKQSQQTMSSRRAAFEQQTKLTTARPATTAATDSGGPSENGSEVGKQVKEYRKKHRQKEAEKDDLVSRLTRGLSKRPFLECPICFNSINPAQPIWSCLPPCAPFEPSAAHPDAPANYAQACYTPFHLSCIRDWANRSLAEEADKLRDRAEDVNGAEWRCPGCQKRRGERVGGYRCFCGKAANPATNGPAPHSCGEGCARKRLGCGHACPLPCHPGPCPPCQVALMVPCPSHHTSLTVKCAVSTSNNAALSPVCDEMCGKTRSCGHPGHTCELSCHFGDCAPCAEVELVKCYCGEEERDVECGWRRGDEKECTSRPEPGVEEHWRGRFDCGRLCGRKYDCGIHECNETCHPHPIRALPCPTSPEVITTCPCGATPLSVLPGYPRTNCLAPVPTCAESCPRSRPCGHKCPLTCHEGDCPPCHEKVTRPCRCGESVMTIPCDIMREKVEAGEDELTCERVCKALRTCGRHECGRLCCPLSFKAKSKGAGKRRVDDALLGGHQEEEELHACPLTCGKMLSCGLHACPKMDHKGACGRCLQASYDELICHCGRTVIYPPVACGTTINCLYPCARPAPACGHPKTPHSCHESPECPPCPYLTAKPCACGKDPRVMNIRCSQDRVSCGQVCGTPLDCGFHKCDRSCHTPGECPSCTQVCSKPKRACKHPCTATCHAPAKCPENDPCQAIITQTCACGNLQTRTSCGATTSSPTSRETAALKCNSECLVKQRNARLADALGIKVDGRGDHVWADDLKAFATANTPFVVMVEGKFKEFFASSRQTMILPHTKRTFVFALADAYRLGRELIDQEPNTSVMIRRRVDTRVPAPLLSSTVSQPVNKPSFGGLANLRGSAVTPSSTAAAAAAAAAAVPSAWGRSSTATAPPSASGLGSFAAASGARTPTAAAAAAASSASVTPRPSRPATPVAPIVRAGGQAPKVGEVGKVEDVDWDQSGDEA